MESIEMIVRNLLRVRAPGAHASFLFHFELHVSFAVVLFLVESRRIIRF